MKLGTIVYESKIYNLDYMTMNELENLLKEIEEHKIEYVSDTLKKMYDDSEKTVRLKAMISRAYTDKISTEIIGQKVNSQMNAITAGIRDINPKFKEGSKNYDDIKNKIISSLTDYEVALKELSDFYDGKIEQLILRKVELEAKVTGIAFNAEHLQRKKIKKINQKEKDGVRFLIASNISKMIEKLKVRKKENKEPDVRLVETLKDGNDVHIEIGEKMESRVGKTEQEEKDNKQVLETVKKEIRLIEDEIKRINQGKEKSLNDAMEVGDKAIATTIKRPRIFKNITRFFANKFNTQKMIVKNVIEPLNQRILDFNNNELSNIKN